LFIFFHNLSRLFLLRQAHITGEEIEMPGRAEGVAKALSTPLAEILDHPPKAGNPLENSSTHFFALSK